MQPNERDHWFEKINKYFKDEWSDKPSLFAQFAVSYFPPKGSLLELGSGSGQDSVWFATKGYEVTQSDAVDAGFEGTLELAKKNGVSLIQSVVDLWQPIPFKDSTFEIVYAQLSLHYFTEAQTRKIFAEIKRVLKPGGKLATLFNSTTDPEYGEGTELETDYFQIKKLRKRFFSIVTTREFAKDFKILLVDANGETYKDNAIGVDGLVRLIAEKHDL